MSTDSSETSEQSGDASLGPGPYAKILVEGPGTCLTEDVLRLMFEPDSRGSDAASLQVGLSAVRGAFEQNSGCVFINSNKNAGTTYTILFPLLRGPGIGRPGPSRDAARAT